jgi:hypothetical protein
VLGYLTEDKEFIPAKTNAQLDPTHIYLDEDGYLYLKSYVDDTVDRLKDAEGHPISLKGEKGEKGQDGVDGKDGQDGVNGVDGKDGITPQLKIVDGYWRVSYNGKDWEELGKATEALALDAKQDKISDELKTAYKEIPKAINEVLYYVWNPVLYETLIIQGNSNPNTSPCGIVLNDNGSMSLTWKNINNANPFSINVKQTNGKPARFVTKSSIGTELSETNWSKLDTANKTIIGAINELASFHYLSDSYFTTYSYPTSLINFDKVDLAVESSS